MRHVNDKGRRALMALSALVLAAGTAAAGTLNSFDVGPQSYAGSQLRRVQVYVPDGLSGPAPMVMALHGCQETEQNVLQDWGLRAAADRYGFVLVAPFITRYDGLRNTNCWGFWLDQHRHQGAGEVEDLRRIGQEVERRWRIDPARRFITGLSSGGAMTVVAAVAHNEYWAAAASAAGLGYGEDAASVSFSGCPGSATFHSVDRLVADMRSERDSSYALPLMVLQNQQDCTVLARAGELLRDAQLKLQGDAAHDTPAEAQAEEKACSPVFGTDYGCRHTRYTVDALPGSRSIVETVFYSGPVATPSTSDTDHGHYWIGGEQGLDGNWALRQGPSYPDIVWSFFTRHPRTDGGTTPPPPPPPPATDCTGTAASPMAHVAAARAVQGGLFNLRALATADQQDIGFAYDSWSSVRLYQVLAGRWQLARPASCGG
jgi:poly(hydroxyalkanoate) depolymerase family esterase